MTKLLARLALLVLAASTLFAEPVHGDDAGGWKKDAAGRYLDDRCTTWFAFARADRGEGVSKTSCVCCHTIVPYALARPVLRKTAGAPTDQEKQLFAQIKLRVENWVGIDTPAYRLLYDFSAQKKKESRGTEAILNALMLAFTDRYAGRTAPAETTSKAFAILWQTQAADGPAKGSWDWLNFGFEPWESTGGRYYGAALAAIAVATAPGYYSPSVDAGVDAKVDLLRSFLRQGVAGQNLYNRAWALWAASSMDGILTADQRKEIISQLLAKQRADGGWSLSSLGSFTRMDGTPEETVSDGYATGLVLHVLQTAGVTKAEGQVAQGLAWLKANQKETGAWTGFSVNKKRDPTSHIGKFMADAATGYAVLALSH
jgi:squalene-hopene/tetraprenyl-beta-curcumene cyclase